LTKRRGAGEGTIFWNEGRQRWVVLIDVGFTVDGKRQRRFISGRTKTEAKAKLLQARRDLVDGLPAESQSYRVGEAVEAWLENGLIGRDPSTIKTRRIMAERHILPALGNRRLLDLTTREVDRWLAEKAQTLSTDSVHRLLSILRRSITRAQAHDLVRRNVALLCTPPRGQSGRPSKSLNLAEARALLDAAMDHPLHAYVVIALMTGARTEELRALIWSHLDLNGDPPTIKVWRSVRRGGDTKTARSRRTLELPLRCVDALQAHAVEARAIGLSVRPEDLVFRSARGTALDAANVRRSFRTVARDAGLDPAAWTPRELRHSFVSLLSSSGMPIEEIAHLAGHASSLVTEKIYRKELRPVLTRGARAMDTILGAKSEPLASSLASRSRKRGRERRNPGDQTPSGQA
jgi:integrase